jgi:hypothetical protein
MPGRNFKSASITIVGWPTGGPTDRHPRFLLFKLTRAPTGEWERALMTVCFVGIAPSRRFARHKSGLKIAQIVAESAAACLFCSSVTEPFAHKRVIFTFIGFCFMFSFTIEVLSKITFNKKCFSEWNATVV